MFVVPRSSGGASASISGGSSSSSSSVIDINGIGFLGFVLVRDPTIDAQSIRLHNTYHTYNNYSSIYINCMYI